MALRSRQLSLRVQEFILHLGDLSLEGTVGFLRKRHLGAYLQALKLLFGLRELLPQFVALLHQVIIRHQAHVPMLEHVGLKQGLQDRLDDVRIRMLETRW